MTREQFKARMRRKNMKLRGEFEQMIRDVDSWNENRTDAPPMDCGPERVLLSLVNQSIAAIDRDDMDEHTRLSKEMVAQAERMCAID